MLLMGRKPRLFFGDGRDGDFNSAGDVVLPVDEEDVTTVVKQYRSFWLNEGHTLSVDRRCRGLLIYSQRDVIIDGTINMDQRSPMAVPIEDTLPHVFPVNVDRGLLWPGQSVDPAHLVVAYALIGGAGGDGGSSGTSPGGAGGYPSWYGGGWGGGGAGGGAGSVNVSSPPTYPGGKGGRMLPGDILGNPGLPQSTSSGGVAGEDGGYGAGGSGAASRATSGSATSGAGGAGPGGGGGGAATRYNQAGMTVGGDGKAGSAYGGGLLVIIAGGNVTINGSILARGGPGGDGGDGAQAGSGGALAAYGGGGGGGGGGGCVLILHRGEFILKGTIDVSGGTGGAGGSGAGTGAAPGNPGSPGTIGSIKVVKIG